MSYELKDKKILVTGATGFIGGHVTKRLLLDGLHVRAMARNKSKAEFLAARGAEIVYGDMTESDSLKNAVQGCQVIFHFAGAVSEYKPLTYFRSINVDGTKMLAEAAIDAHIERFLYACSIRVFGLDAEKNTDESCAHNPSNDMYSDTKLEGEKVIRTLIKNRGLPAVIVYPSVVYGPYDDAWTMISINLIRQGRMMLFDGGKGMMTPIFIDDLVNGVLAAAQKGVVGEGYILVGPENVTVGEFEKSLAHIVGRDHLHSLPSWAGIAIATLAELEAKIFRHAPVFTRRQVRRTIMQATYSGKKAKDELGFEPHAKLSDGMHKVEEWLVATGRL